jgi:hypothetical protein
MTFFIQRPKPKYTGFFISWIEDWSQFFRRCNWYTFRLISVELEDDRMMGGVDLTAILLGVGFCARFNYARTDKVDEIIAAVDEIVRATDDTPRTPKPSDD